MNSLIRPGMPAPGARLGPAFWLAAPFAAAAAAVVVGLPTAIVASPIFTRMTPVRPLDYAFWLASAVLLGVLAASYVPGAVSRAACIGGPAEQSGRASAGGLLSVLAVGCPTCNKLVVLGLGASGALTYFAPLQPLIGLVSLALLGYALWARLRALGVLRAADGAGGAAAVSVGV